ncbi:hypothetical protein ND861_08265 [Leptospira sp. 2 VSF19]|uniref:Uncharacterized protein n=1 Tax=Leptospira soteropolitanensis TaxID=2950025 RepID=A0AAW5VE81_9LEPT|nr:hypothetical protein [Leptospira soteropolitanensis]MCW7492989.1 hypothetical protein [Leptospira soteropolitanensis]MCW7500224.1 hypothetical protein [Leptospira soteropolitanensis]MCW7522475.1 hypothetical protein [Leptospira soteropolitanensis]MCW7526331.1 hypothetical protein [Leptospira soteropolitanensis]MCW7529557.1 hypothetical protein [Leptospira soteropolitanensis]
MFVGFVENQNRKKPDPSEEPTSSFFVFWTGLSFICGFGIFLLPFGAFFPLSVSVWAILILFLPVLFLGILLTKRTGFKILLAVFLSLLAGGNSVLFLGDSIGYHFGITSKMEVLPEEVSQYLNYRYLFLRDFYLDDVEKGEFRSPLLVRRRSGGAVYGPVIRFHYKRIRSISGKEIKPPLYAICYSKEDIQCNLSGLFSGGVVLKEPIWDMAELPFAKDSLFLVWRGPLDAEMFNKGIYSCLFFLFLNLVWAVIVYFPGLGEKES